MRLSRAKSKDIFSKIISISCNGDNDRMDTTDNISQVVTESELDSDILIIFVFGSTSAIETTEPRRGLKIEIPFMVSRLIPLNTIYKYDIT
ncbi:MAG TPA: hypothetical protein VFI64_01535 [Nitrososphaeraceae archaeon]|nr:hypothetical protein [Nitrososphaeraceae archaeon]